jgi:hypothetical protein
VFPRIPGIHYIYTRYTLYIHQVYTIYTPGIHYIYTRYTLYIHQVYTIYTPGIHYIYQVYTIYTKVCGNPFKFVDSAISATSIVDRCIKLSTQPCNLR